MHSSKNFIEKPINLLTFDSFGHAILHEEAIEFIQSVPKPVSILSIAGPYRTGKSFLLNSIISAESRFEISETTNSCTKGIWIWGKPLLSIDEQGKITNVLVIDTEGFGSCSEVHDKRIIIFALLLSTCFIYNSKGAIDKNSLQDLQFVIEETKKVKRSISFDSITDFHWVLRDFHLQLTNELGLKISPDEYMEKCLKEFSDQSKEQKETYELLCDFFRNRSCHTFVAPEINPSEEQNPQFMEQILKFKKIINGIPSLDLDGVMLTEIIDAYVSAMNENFPMNGVYKEGEECRLRLNCLTQLYREFENICNEEQAEKREKLLKLALSQAQSEYIEKMTSQKQIQLLKEEINILLSEYEDNTPDTSYKNIKIPEPRNSIQLVKQRDYRTSSFMEDNIGDSRIKNSRVELMAVQRVREELEGKVHRYELIVEELKKEVSELKIEGEKNESIKNELEEKLIEMSEEMLKKQKSYYKDMIELKEEVDNIRKEKMLQCSELEKKGELLQDKIIFLEERAVYLEINQNESTSGLANRYKQQITYLEAENEELTNKHQRELEEIKLIYQMRKENDENSQKNIVSERTILVGDEMKQYIEEISKLQTENNDLMISKTKLENRMIEIEHEHDQLKLNSLGEIEALNKRIKEKEEGFSEIHTHAFLNKDKMIKELEIKLEEEIKNHQEVVDKLNREIEEQCEEINELTLNFESEIRKVKEECVDIYERLEVSESLNGEREKEVQRLNMEIENQRRIGSEKFHENQTALQKLREELEKQRESNDNLIKMNEELNESENKLQKELLLQKEENDQINEQRSKINQIEISRLEQRIESLNNSNLSLKKIHEEYDILNASLFELTNEKHSLIQQIEQKDQMLQKLAMMSESSAKENQKLEKIIQELTLSLKASQEEFQQFSEKNNEKLEQKEAKYLELLEKMHEKEKTFYMFNESSQSFQKDYEIREKEFTNLLAQKMEEKNSEIIDLNKQNSEFVRKIEELMNQNHKTTQENSLIKQRCQFLEQSHEEKLDTLKADYEKEIKSHESQIRQINVLLKKQGEEKIQLEKTIRILENDARETCGSISVMQAKYDKNCDRYEANLKLMRKRVNELEEDNKVMKEKMDKMIVEIGFLSKNKELLESNYAEDFKIWSSKVTTLQSRLIN